MTPGVETVTLAGRNGAEDPVRAAEEALDGGAHPSSVVRRYAEDARAQGRLSELDGVLGDFDQLAGRIELHEWLLRNEPERANGQGPREVFDAADLLDDPERLRVPEALVPGIIFPESFTLYSGPPNVGGKTSLLVAGAAAMATGGRFLGEWTTPGRVLWIMGEGSEIHLGRYLAQIEAEVPRGRFIIVRSGPDPLGELEEAVAEYDPDAVVVDSLGTWSAPLDVDLYTEEVVPPLRFVERIARTGPGVVMLHHGRKEDGDPAGSHKIQAVPDIVRTVEVGETPRERVIQGVGRWRLPEVRYRMEVTGEHSEVPDLETVRFRVVDPDRELEEKVLDVIEAEPGCSKRHIREVVDGRNPDVDEAVQDLVEDGIVERDRSGRAHTHRIAQEAHGHATGTVSDNDGHGGSDNDGETVPESAPPSSSRKKGGTPARPPESEDSDEEGGEEVAL